MVEGALERPREIPVFARGLMATILGCGWRAGRDSGAKALGEGEVLSRSAARGRRGPLAALGLTILRRVVTFRVGTGMGHGARFGVVAEGARRARDGWAKVRLENGKRRDSVNDYEIRTGELA